MFKDKILKLADFLKGVIASFFDIFFDQNQKETAKFLVWFYIFLLYVLGVFFWGGFFNWGNIDLNFHDWAAINVPRIEVVHDALSLRLLPLHAECETCLHGVTDRFFVLPDVITSPQMILLLFVSPPVFVFFDVLLHYSIATIGLLLLRKRFHISLISYTFLFLTFQFNGYIQSHYAVGHATWTGYFLFPLFFELIFELLYDKPSWAWVAKFAFLSFYSTLVGSQHHFTWMMLFMATLALSFRSAFKWIVAAILFSGFLSAIRLLPPALGINGFSHFFFGVPGYLTIYDFLTSLFSLRGPTYTFIAWPYEIGYWEFDYYIGLVGTIVLIYFGVIRWFKDWSDGKIHSALIFPTLVLFSFSQSYIYQETMYRIPFLASERIASRMVSLPFTLVLIVSAIYLSEGLRMQKMSHQLLALISVVFVMNDVFIHRSLWKIQSVSTNFPVVELDFSGNSIVNHADPRYFLVLCLGLGLSLFSAFVLGLLVAKEKKFTRK